MYQVTVSHAAFGITYASHFVHLGGGFSAPFGSTGLVLVHLQGNCGLRTINVGELSVSDKASKYKLFK